MTLSLLQISDLHLGARFGWLPLERREARRREQEAALAEAVRQAIERRVDAILVPGDLFDRDGVGAASVAAAVHAFDVEGCPPVFVAPGNHDPWSDASPYWNPRLLGVRGWKWPAHVHVFGSESWSALPIPNRPARVWGRCFVSDTAGASRPLSASQCAAVDRRGIEVALLHGSREGHLPAGQKSVAPFSDAEVTATPFDYVAAGHYHKPSRLQAGEPVTVRMAYAGSPIALGLDELGAHGALEVRIAPEGEGYRTETEFVPLDRRCVFDLTVDVTGGASAAEVDRRVLAALDRHGVTDRDWATVRLEGRLVRGVRYAAPGREASERAGHLRVDGRRLRPDYDLDAYRTGYPRTSEDRFVTALLERMERETDPEARALCEHALYYGLDAFRLGEVVPGLEEAGT